MAENSTIEWCHDSVGIWEGCTEKGPGCLNCYAKDGYPIAIVESQTGRRGWASNNKPGESGAAVRFYVAGWLKTLERLNRKAEKSGERRRVFINPQADFFEDTGSAVVDRKSGARLYNTTSGRGFGYMGDGMVLADPVTLGDLRRKAFEAFDRLTWLDILLLTKRPQNVEKMWMRRAEYLGTSPCLASDFYRPNVWIGTSVEDQQRADERREHLEALRDLTPVLFVSYEPALGPVNWNGWEFLDWLISGGESGQHARPAHPDWFRGSRDFCQANGIAYLHKQNGEWLPISEMPDAAAHLYRSNKVARDGESQAALDDIYGRTCRVEKCGIQHDGQRGWNGGDPFVIPYLTFRVGKKAAGRLLDGVEWNEFPRLEVLA